jgi:ribonuclease HI
MPHKHVRRLFVAIALPKIEYAAEVWFEPIRKVPGRRSLKGSVGHANRIAKVQNLAARLITGAQRTTPIDLLLLHANLIPTRLRMEEQLFKATLRLCSLPEYHPLLPYVRKCANRYVQSHRSPLHELFHAFDLHPDCIETLHPIRFYPPSWSPRFTTYIADDKDEAADYCRGRNDDIRIYTDGSGLDGGIGAASVCFYRGETHTAHYHLGSSSTHTVFEGETCGVILATHQVISIKPHNPKSLLIALDNQPLLRALSANTRQRSQYLLDEALKGLENIRKKWPNISITLVWAPGHHGLQENELVDEEAKKAANRLSSTILPKSLRRPIPESTAALKAHKHTSLRQMWLQLWTDSTRYKKFARIDPWSNAKAMNRTLSHLPRNQSSLLMQLRSGHDQLNAHLSRIKQVPSNLCPRCLHAPETASYVLISCPLYATARKRLISKTGHAAFSIRRLLSDPKIIPSTFIFLKETKRLRTFI